MRKGLPRVSLALTLLAAPVGAQSITPSAATRPSPGSGTLALMALGGSVGSLAGIGLVALASSCGGDDLACTILSVGAGGAAGAIGATVGTMVVARGADVRASTFGAGLGAVAGTAVGLGVHYLLNRGTSRNFDTPGAVVPIFALAQGIFAALGSQWIK